MVSDQDLAKGVETLLRQSDPNTLTSLNSVIQQLESKLGLDLSDKTNFIRDQINHLLRTPQPPSIASSSIQPHFTLNHYPSSQFAPSQQFPSHFTPYHSYDLNFRQPYPPYMPRQQQGAASSVLLPHGSNVVVTHTPKESAPAKRKGGPGGLNKVCRVSPELQVVVGEPALPRTEIVKKLWAYIRKHSLQDPSNKRKIICDDALRVVFETDCTDMFKMNKLLAKHILPLDPSKDAGQAKKAKTAETKIETKTETTEPVPVNAAVTLSEPLAKFFGTGETDMKDEEIIRRVWEYIKLNKLEVPENPMAIQCDEKLRDLLGCESISAVGINEMLRRHMYKRS